MSNTAVDSHGFARLPHWSDEAPSPVFSTVLRARGSAGNVHVVLAQAVSWLRQLQVPEDRVRDLTRAVYDAPSYEAALAAVERWFRVER